MDLDERLHVAVRERTQQLLDAGAKPKKKLLRFNDCVEACKRYARCGTTFDDKVALSAVNEVVESCFPFLPGETTENPMYSDDGPIGLVPDWMLFCEEPT